MRPYKLTTSYGEEIHSDMMIVDNPSVEKISKSSKVLNRRKTGDNLETEESHPILGQRFVLAKHFDVAISFLLHA